ncbi:MAG: hypothetical protein WC933_00880 [Candidatus Paceibacterota bacterium]
MNETGNVEEIEALKMASDILPEEKTKPKKKEKEDPEFITVRFFIKAIRENGKLQVVDVGTREDILSLIKAKGKGLRYCPTESANHHTEDYVMKAINKQVLEIDSKKDKDDNSFALTAFLEKKKKSLVFKKIGTDKEIRKVAKSWWLKYEKGKEEDKLGAYVRMQFLEALKISHFADTVH